MKVVGISPWWNSASGQHEVGPRRWRWRGTWCIAHVIPIPGASRPETILDSLAAAELTLSDDELLRLDAD